MKKYITYILLACLLLSCFAGCKQENPTPTDVTSTDETQVEATVTETAVQENDSISQEQSDATEEQSNVQVQSAATKKPTGTTKKEATTQSKPKPTPSVVSKVDPVKIHGDIAQNNPTFVSEQALQTWLQYGSGAYENNRAEYLKQAVKNNKLTYLHPQKTLNNFVSLDNIEFHTPSQSYTYYYLFDDGKDLTMIINTAKVKGFYEGEEFYYNGKKQGLLDGKKDYGHYYDTDSGIDFYWNYADFDKTQVVWIQDGLIHSASFTGHKDIIKTLLPCLVLEQVTVNLNSNHVTQ